MLGFQQSEATALHVKRIEICVTKSHFATALLQNDSAVNFHLISMHFTPSYNKYS